MLQNNAKQTAASYRNLKLRVGGVNFGSTAIELIWNHPRTLCLMSCTERKISWQSGGTC